jgi:hypothetical protein
MEPDPGEFCLRGTLGFWANGQMGRRLTRRGGPPRRQPPGVRQPLPEAAHEDDRTPLPLTRPIHRPAHAALTKPHGGKVGVRRRSAGRCRGRPARRRQTTPGSGLWEQHDDEHDETAHQAGTQDAPSTSLSTQALATASETARASAGPSGVPEVSATNAAAMAAWASAAVAPPRVPVTKPSLPPPRWFSQQRGQPASPAAANSSRLASPPADASATSSAFRLPGSSSKCHTRRQQAAANSFSLRSLATPPACRCPSIGRRSVQRSHAACGAGDCCSAGDRRKWQRRGHGGRVVGEAGMHPEPFTPDGAHGRFDCVGQRAVCHGQALGDAAAMAGGGPGGWRSRKDRGRHPPREDGRWRES